MPRVGCDAKLMQTTGCMVTRSAPMITQQARVTDPLMAQCWSSFYDAGTTLTYQHSHYRSCFSGHSKFTLNSLIALSLYFEMSVRYKITDWAKKKTIYFIEFCVIRTAISHGQGRAS